MIYVHPESTSESERIIAPEPVRGKLGNNNNMYIFVSVYKVLTSDGISRDTAKSAILLR